MLFARGFVLCARLAAAIVYIIGVVFERAGTEVSKVSVGKSGVLHGRLVSVIGVGRGRGEGRRCLVARRVRGLGEEFFVSVLFEELVEGLGAAGHLASRVYRVFLF